jgi:hypothetical protein
VAKEMQADIAALLQQKKDVSTALLDTTRSAQSLANLKQDQQVLTSRLCKLTGMAKVKGVINHLKNELLLIQTSEAVAVIAAVVTVVVLML